MVVPEGMVSRGLGLLCDLDNSVHGGVLTIACIHGLVYGKGMYIWLINRDRLDIQRMV